MLKEALISGNFKESVGNVQAAAQAVSPASLWPVLINRDLSLVEFFWRVLEEAFDDTQPLLERVKFVSIFSSIVDEFFMIRIPCLQERAGCVVGVSQDGLTPAEQLVKIRERILELLDLQYKVFQDELIPALASEDVVLTRYTSLSDGEQQALIKYFKEKIYPILTPQAVDPSHPFPYISGGSLNLGVMVKPSLNPRVERAQQHSGEELFVRVKIPQFLPRLIQVDDHPSKYVWIEDLIASNIRLLVPEASPEACHFFRITRDADIELRESEAQDLLETMEENLKLRRFGYVTRLEVSSGMPGEMLGYLSVSLEVQPDDIYTIPGPINLGEVSALTKLNRPDLTDRPLRTTRPEIFTGDYSMFDLIKRGDIMLHHPYMPYAIVTDFIREAAEDPDVLAIKICLYRMGGDSPIPPLLIKARELGKQVTVLIELKARFDEANNIEWARRLEQAGVHVIYGLLGLKTHAKTTLIIRREGDELRRYVHAATGNYNPETSAAYTDLGLLTVDDDIGADATELFNFLTVYSKREDYRKLLVAPIDLRERMLEFIKRETEHARNGRQGRIIAKLNRLADSEIIHALYEGSQAGVKIDLIVRGVCTLRPGIEGLSENITVRSIVGSLLEHSRVYYFENGGENEIFIGSSDWMPRNLDRRVEVLTPVESPDIKDHLKNEYLAAYLKDNVKARILMPDGKYRRITPREGEEPFNAQEAFQGASNLISIDVGR
jgi:polyphosphate kinase